MLCPYRVPMAGRIMALRKCVCANRRATRREKERGGLRGREWVRVCKRVLILVHVIFSIHVHRASRKIVYLRIPLLCRDRLRKAPPIACSLPDGLMYNIEYKYDICIINNSHVDMLYIQYCTYRCYAAPEILLKVLKLRHTCQCLNRHPTTTTLP